MTGWQEASQTIDRMVYFISSWFLITFTFSEFTAALSVMRFSFNSLIDWSFPLQIECDLEGNQTFSLPTNLLMYIPNGWTWKILLIYKCQATKRCSSRTDRRPWCREKMMKMPARRYWLVLVLYFVCCLMFRLPHQSSPDDLPSSPEHLRPGNVVAVGSSTAQQQRICCKAPWESVTAMRANMHKISAKRAK